MPISMTSTGSALVTRDVRASREASGISVSARSGIRVAAAAGPVSKVRRKSAVLERSLVSGTHLSSVRITSTRSHGRETWLSAAKTGPGEVPPGTANVTRSRWCSAATSASPSTSATSITKSSRSG